MAGLVTFAGALLMLTTILISTVYLLRSWVAGLVCRRLGVVASVEQLGWGGCKRLRLQLNKGPVGAFSLESASLRFADGSGPKLGLLRLALAVGAAVWSGGGGDGVQRRESGGGEADGGGGSSGGAAGGGEAVAYLTVALQGVRVELREGQRQGAAGARRKDKGQSQARKKAVRPPRPPALPVLLLRLAPLVRLEVREVAVTAPVLDDSRQAPATAEAHDTSSGSNSGAVLSPATVRCLTATASLGSLVLSADCLPPAVASEPTALLAAVHAVTGTAAGAGADGADGGALSPAASVASREDTKTGNTGGRVGPGPFGNVAGTAAAAAAAVSTVGGDLGPEEAGEEAGGGQIAAEGVVETQGRGTSAATTRLGVELRDLQLTVRQSCTRESTVWTTKVAAGSAAGSADGSRGGREGTIPGGGDGVGDKEGDGGLLAAVRVSSLAAAAVCGRSQRPGARTGQLLGLGASVGDVALSCYAHAPDPHPRTPTADTAAGAAAGGKAAAGDGNAATAAAAAQVGPLTEAVIALANLAAGSGSRSKRHVGSKDRKQGGRSVGGSTGTAPSGLPSGAAAAAATGPAGGGAASAAAAAGSGGAEAEDKVAALIGRLALLLPSQVSLRTGSLRLAAHLRAAPARAAHPGRAQPGARQPSASTSAPAQGARSRLGPAAVTVASDASATPVHGHPGRHLATLQLTVGPSRLRATSSGLLLVGPQAAAGPLAGGTGAKKNVAAAAGGGGSDSAGRYAGPTAPRQAAAAPTAASGRKLLGVSLHLGQVALLAAASSPTGDQQGLQQQQQQQHRGRSGAGLRPTSGGSGGAQGTQPPCPVSVALQEMSFRVRASAALAEGDSPAARGGGRGNDSTSGRVAGAGEAYGIAGLRGVAGSARYTVEVRCEVPRVKVQLRPEMLLLPAPQALGAGDGAAATPAPPGAPAAQGAPAAVGLDGGCSYAAILNGFGAKGRYDFCAAGAHCFLRPQAAAVASAAPPRESATAPEGRDAHTALGGAGGSLSVRWADSLPPPLEQGEAHRRQEEEAVSRASPLRATVSAAAPDSRQPSQALSTPHASPHKQGQSQGGGVPGGPSALDSLISMDRQASPSVPMSNQPSQTGSIHISESGAAAAPAAAGGGLGPGEEAAVASAPHVPMPSAFAQGTAQQLLEGSPNPKRTRQTHYTGSSVAAPAPALPAMPQLQSSAEGSRSLRPLMAHSAPAAAAAAAAAAAGRPMAHSPAPPAPRPASWSLDVSIEGFEISGANPRAPGAGGGGGGGGGSAASGTKPPADKLPSGIPSLGQQQQHQPPHQQQQGSGGRRSVTMLQLQRTTFAMHAAAAAAAAASTPAPQPQPASAQPRPPLAGPGPQGRGAGSGAAGGPTALGSSGNKLPAPLYDADVTVLVGRADVCLAPQELPLEPLMQLLGEAAGAASAARAQLRRVAVASATAGSGAGTAGTSPFTQQAGQAQEAEAAGAGATAAAAAAGTGTAGTQGRAPKLSVEVPDGQTGDGISVPGAAVVGPAQAQQQQQQQQYGALRAGGSATGGGGSNREPWLSSGVLHPSSSLLHASTSVLFEASPVPTPRGTEDGGGIGSPAASTHSTSADPGSSPAGHTAGEKQQPAGSGGAVRQKRAPLFALHSVSIDFPYGIGVTCRTAVPVDPSHSALPAGVAAVGTTLALQVASAFVVAWPRSGRDSGRAGKAAAAAIAPPVALGSRGDTAAARAAEQAPQVEPSATAQVQLSSISLELSRDRSAPREAEAAGAAAAAGSAGAGAPPRGADSAAADAARGGEGPERQQLLRVDRVRVLQVEGVACPAPATDGPSPGEPGKLMRLELSRTRGSLDVDAALAVVAAVQDLADAAAGAVWARTAAATAVTAAVEPKLTAATAAPAAGSKGAAGASGGGKSTGKGKAAKGPTVVELRANDTEMDMAIGPRDTVTLLVGSLRHSSGLKSGAVEGFAARVNGRRFLDVDLLAFGPAEPFQPYAPSPKPPAHQPPAPKPQPASRPEVSFSGFPPAAAGRHRRSGSFAPHRTSGSAATSGSGGGADSVSTSLSVGGAMIGGGSGPARHRRSASAATFAADAMGAAAADATSLPSEDTVLSWLTLAASTAASGSGSGRPPTPGGTWMPRPAPPPAAELQPWATVLAAGGRLSAAEEDTKSPLYVATSTARRRAGRERFQVPLEESGASSSSTSSSAAAAAAAAASRPAGATAAGGPAPTTATPSQASASASASAPKLNSIKLMLYGAALTVPYDESASRVYVVYEVWSRAAKQVLNPRVARLNATLQLLKKQPTAPKAPAATASGATAHAGRPPQPPQPPLPDKALVEILLDVRRLAVVVEHQPLEASLALHGSLLQATATRRHAYESFYTSALYDNPKKLALREALEASALGPGGPDAPDTPPLGRPGAAGAGESSPVVPRGAGAGTVGVAASPKRGQGGGAHTPGALSVGSRASPKVPPAESGGEADSSSPRKKAARQRRPTDDDLSYSSDGGAESGDDTDASSSGSSGSGSGSSSGSGSDGGVSDVEDDIMAAPERGLADEDIVEQMRSDVASAFLAACRAVRAAATAAAAAAGPSAAAASAANAAAAAARGSPSGSSCTTLAGCPAGALLHLAVAGAEACIVVSPAGCRWGRRVAEAAIRRIDGGASGPAPPLAFERMVPLSLDLSAHGIRGTLGSGAGGGSPTVSIAQAGLSGWIIRARQLAAPPRTTVVRWPVGRHHSVGLPTAVRFARPPNKSYTDLKAEADGLSAAYSTALEPTLAQLVKALKQRVLPPPPQQLRPDGTALPSRPPAPGGAPSPSGLPPWDNVRYTWRGSLKVTVRALTAVLGASPLALPAAPTDPRVDLTAATLGLTWAGGRMELAATALTAVGHAPGAGCGPGDPLVRLPLLHLPQLTACLHSTFTQPHASTHYAFPLLLEAPPPDAPIQEPVDVPGMMRSTSLSLAVDVSLRADPVSHLPPTTALTLMTTAAAAVAAPPVGALAAAAGLTGSPAAPQLPLGGVGGVSYSAAATAAAATASVAAAAAGVAAAAAAVGGGQGLPRVYVGEMQLKFLFALIRGMAGGAPVALRGAWKRRAFYDPPRPAPPQPLPAAVGPGADSTAAAAPPPPPPPPRAPGLGGVVSALDINVTADVFDVCHDAQDPMDPSDMVCLRANNVRYANSFTYTQALHTRVYPGGRTVQRMRPKPTMAALNVAAYDMRLFMPYGGTGTTWAAGGAGATQGSAPGAAAAGISSGGAHGSRASAAAGTGVSTGGGIPAAASSSAAAAGAHQQQASFTATPGFESGLIAECDCLLLGLSSPAAGSQAAQQPPPRRTVRINVQDIKVMCTIDTRHAVIATTAHIVNAFLPTSQPAPPSRSAHQAHHAQTHSRQQPTPAPEWHRSESAPARAAVTAPDQSALGGQQQEAGGTASQDAVLYGVDPRDLEEERALVALLREQNEARRAQLQAARAQQQQQQQQPQQDAEQPGCPPETLSRVSDPAPISTSAHDPLTELADAEATDEPPADGDASVLILGDGTSVVLQTDQGPANMQQQQVQAQTLAQQLQPFTSFQVEFERVQVGLLCENAAATQLAGCCLVLATRNAALRGERAPLQGRKAMAFEMSKLQAYAGRFDHLFRDGAAAGQGLALRPPGGGSFSPLSDGLMTGAATAAAPAMAAGGGGASTSTSSGGGPSTGGAGAAAAGGAQRPMGHSSGAQAGAGLPPRHGLAAAGQAGGDGWAAGAGAGAAAASSLAAPQLPPIIWLRSVNGQLEPPTTVTVPCGPGTAPPPLHSRSSSAGGLPSHPSQPAPGLQHPLQAHHQQQHHSHHQDPKHHHHHDTRQLRVTMRKILNPFRISLVSSRPWVAPALLQQQQRQELLAQRVLTEQQLRRILDAPPHHDLDITCAAISGQMESWQFQLLLAVINDTTVALMPQLLSLTRGSQALPGCDDDTTRRICADARRKLRSLQHEKLILTQHLALAAPPSAVPYGVAATEALQQQLHTVLIQHHHLQQQQQVAASTHIQQEQQQEQQQQQQRGISPSISMPARGSSAFATGLAAAAAAAAAAGGARAGSSMGGGWDLHQQHQQQQAGAPYTAALFKPPALTASPSGRLLLGTDAVLESRLVQLLLAPRRTRVALSPDATGALLRRNAELLLHWLCGKVQEQQDFVERMSAVLAKSRAYNAAAAAGAPAQRRRGTSVSVTVGSFGWALLKPDGTPFVEAELLGLSFHHTLDREHMGATKVRMQAANLWELRHGVTIVLAGHQHQHQQQQVQLVQMPLAPPAAAPGQPGAPPSGTSMSAGGAGAGAGAAAPEAGLGSRGPAAAGAGKSSRALSVTEGGGAGAAGGSGIVRREPIVGLWRPDDSSSWEEEPLLLMRVVHGGVDAQWVTYEHIEVTMHPLQVRLTYSLATQLADYFSLGDEEEKEREEAAKRERERETRLADKEARLALKAKQRADRVAARLDRVAARAAAKAAKTEARAEAKAKRRADKLERASVRAAGATLASTSSLRASPSPSPVKAASAPRLAPAGGGSWFMRRSTTAAAAAPSGNAPLAAGAAVGVELTAEGALLQSSGSPPKPGAARKGSPSKLAVPAPAHGPEEADGSGPEAPALSGVPSSPPPPQPHRSRTQPALLLRQAALAHQAADAAVPSPASAVASAAAAAVAAAPPIACGLLAAAAGGGPAAAALVAATAVASPVRYGTAYRRRPNGTVVSLVDLGGGVLVAAVLAGGTAGVRAGGKASAAQQGPAGATAAAPSTAAGGDAAGAAAVKPRARRLQPRFMYVRFNRIAARLTYSGPRFSFNGWGVVIDARAYTDIEGGWKKLLNKYKWDVIYSVIKSAAGIQAGKLKELLGSGPAGGGSSAAFSNPPSTSAAMGMSVGSLGGAGGGDVDLDPDLLLLASSPSDIAAAVVAGGAVGVRGGALSRAAAVSAAANAAVQKTATSLFGGMRQKARAFMSAGGVKLSQEGLSSGASGSGGSSLAPRGSTVGGSKHGVMAQQQLRGAGGAVELAAGPLAAGGGAARGHGGPLERGAQWAQGGGTEGVAWEAMEASTSPGAGAYVRNMRGVGAAGLGRERDAADGGAAAAGGQQERLEYDRARAQTAARLAALLGDVP